jgi:hypothetical protein
MTFFLLWTPWFKPQCPTFQALSKKGKIQHPFYNCVTRDFYTSLLLILNDCYKSLCECYIEHCLLSDICLIYTTFRKAGKCSRAGPLGRAGVDKCTAEGNVSRLHTTPVCIKYHERELRLEQNLWHKSQIIKLNPL